MRILSLIARSGEGSIEIADSKNSDSNWITIITGANGTRKSLVLRLISSAALGFSGIRMGGMIFSPIKIATDKNQKANRVIAVSGTPFDRFTKSGSKKIFTSGDDTHPESPYSYFGFKSVNGSTGALGISRIIGALLWKRRERLIGRTTPLCAIFNFLKLQPTVEVKLRRPPNLNASSRESNNSGLKRGDFNRLQLLPFLQSIHSKYAIEENDDLLAYVHMLMRSKARISKLEKFLAQFPSQIFYDFQEGAATPAFSLNNEFDIERLIDIGLLVIDDLFVRRAPIDKESDALHISASSLSSGQWQLLLGLLGLGLEVENDSIILIDEPENSLHPEWQRQYIGLLENVLAEKAGCHVVIATHSPLITSGVNGERGNLIRLVPDVKSKFGVTSESLTQNFGWDVSETLELLFEMQTTRGSGFVEMVDNALAMIRDQNTSSKDFMSLAASIIEASRNLPKSDPMLQIALAIGNLIPKKAAAL